MMEPRRARGTSRLGPWGDQLAGHQAVIRYGQFCPLSAQPATGLGVGNGWEENSKDVEEQRLCTPAIEILTTYLGNYNVCARTK